MARASRWSLLSLSVVAFLAACGGGSEPPPPPTCTDGARNGAETGVDCGGSTCPRCGTGGGCAGPADCTSGVCTAAICAAPTCLDGVKNGAETAADCGGGTCPRCADGLACQAPADCQSGVCGQGLCRAPDCVDGVKNGFETAVDCGGTCPPCADGLACGSATDCQSGVCASGICAVPTCLDGVRNGAETGIDCGGGCPGCVLGGPCALGTDCGSGVCQAGTCRVATCGNAAADVSETDVDCGGPDCAPCADGKACGGGTDCASGVCQAGLCRPVHCGSGAKDGDETDVDCGGSCAGCGSGRGCSVGGDCLSGACAAGACLKSRGEACTAGPECGSGFCTDAVCCESACGGTCEACNLAGRAGSCDPVPAGTDPIDECPTDAASTCQRTGLCSGARSCALYSAGTVCAAASCAGATLANLDDTCNGGGTCVDAGTQNCFPYACNGATGACRTSCSVDPDCAGGYACAGGTCRKAIGMACGADLECASGFCSDGACCESRCGGTCEKCNQAGRAGFCDPVAAGTDPDNECADQGAASCGTNGLCSGARTCALYPAGTVCVAPTCASATTSNRADTCSGTGICQDSGTASCGLYACDPATGLCRVSCTVSADCAPGNSCVAGQCRLPVGASCSLSSQCASNACCSGFCRDLATDQSNCGACGTVCQTNAGTSANACVAGLCTPTCNPLWGNCDGIRPNGCETPLASLTNCGGCNVSCNLPNASESCTTGTCTLVSCNFGFADCDGSTASGCERQLNVYGNACGGAEFLGTTPGDAFCGFLCPASSYTTFATRTGFTSRWFRVTVSEVSSCTADLLTRITLNVPATVDYDLYVYSACGTQIGASVGGTGATEQLVITKTDVALVVDTYDLWIEVRFFGGASCSTWTLTVEGRNC